MLSVSYYNMNMSIMIRINNQQEPDLMRDRLKINKYQHGYYLMKIIKMCKTAGGDVFLLPVSGC